MQSNKSRITFFTALLLVLFIAGRAHANQWSVPINLSPADVNSTGCQVAVDLKGNAVALWSGFNGSHYVIQSAARDFNGKWSDPSDLSLSGGDAFFAELALDAKGNAIAVWSRYNGSNYVVQGAFKEYKHAWNSPVDISNDTVLGRDAIAPKIVIDSQGYATVVWQISDGTNNAIQMVSKTFKAASWSSPVNISFSQPEGLGGIQPQIGVDLNGNAIAVWINTAYSMIQASTKFFGENWSSPLDLSCCGNAIEGAQIGIDHHGNATVLWSRYDGVNWIIQAVTKPFSGMWSDPIDLSAAGQDAVNPQLSVSGIGNAIAVWQRSDGLNTRVQAATKEIGKNWAPSINLSVSGQDASEPQILIGPQMDVLIWKRSDGSNFIIQAKTKRTGAGWSKAVDLSYPNQDACRPKVALDVFGNLIALWERSDGTHTIVQSAYNPISNEGH